MRWHHLIFLIFSFISPSTGAVQTEIVEYSVEGSSSKPGAAARQEIFDKAIEQASVKYIQDIIGEQKTEKNRNLIREKIIRQSGKYVLYIKGTQTAKNGDDVKMQVLMKVSLKNLEAMLLEEGLLYRMDGPPKIIPFVTITDRVNSQNFSWWSQPASAEKSLLIELTRNLNLKLKKHSRDKGFFTFDPILSKSYELVPSVYRSENLPSDDFLFLGEFFRSQIILRGTVIFSPSSGRSNVYKVDIKISAHHSGNGRIIGEVVRSYETDMGLFNQVVRQKTVDIFDRIASDLTVQMFDAWKSGTFGANMIKLTVKGELNYQQMSQFKKLFLNSMRDVKTLKERFFDRNKVTFELDAESNAQELGEKLAKVSFPRFKVQVDNIRPGDIEIQVDNQ